MEKKMNNKGFSLVELIIVIAIMAILVGVLAPQFIKYVEKSRQSTDIQNVQILKTAVEAAVASGDITANATITLNSANITLDDTNKSKIDGVTLPMTSKSSGWSGDIEFVYNVTNYKWTVTGTTANTKNPNLDVNSVIE